MDCLAEDTLQLLAQGNLSATAAQAVHEHLDVCPTCREVLATVLRSSLLRNPEADLPPVDDASVPRHDVLDAAAFSRDTKLGRYVVVEPLGVGAMGVVLLARDTELDRQVALKLIRPAASAIHGEALHERLRREARAMARLNHPNVVPVYDVGEIGEVIFLAMEYVQGGTLREWLASSPRSWREVLDKFLLAGRGLAAAHAAKVVHRDFKPDNVLVGDDGSVRVADFGLARTASIAAEGSVASSELPESVPRPEATATGLVMGTPAYMAPEILARQPADARSDVFSFCVSLYEALYGERPFAGDALRAIAKSVEHNVVRDAPSGSTVPAWLRRALLQGMRARPEERPDSMDVFLAELSHDPAGRRRRLWPAAIGAAAMVLLLAAAAWFPGWERSKPARATLQGVDSRVVGPSTPDQDESRAAGEDAPAASRLYDDFSAGLSGNRWNYGEYQAVIRDRAAVLSHRIRKVRAFRTHTTDLIVRPPSDGGVTTLQADITLDDAIATGDTSSGAAIDLWFQPKANRLSFPFNTNRLMIVRIMLELQASGPLAARYFILLCRDDFEDCSQGNFIGPVRPKQTAIPPGEEFGSTWRGAAGQMTGTWGRVVPISFRTSYTASISVNAATKVLTFAIADGAGMNLASSVDLSETRTPFTPDLSAPSFYRARLLTRLSGGNIGGGDGSVSARFNNVKVGVDGQPPTTFDDFSTGTHFDPKKWNVGGESVGVAGTALRMSLDQEDGPAVVNLEMADTSASALQSDVTIEKHRSTGRGRIAAQLREALYNDGSAGSGSAPDDNEPNSEVGDVLASINMTDTDVFYVVERCNRAQCSSTGTGFSYIRPYTSLGKITPGSTHRLYIDWDAAHHRILFRLDENPVAVFDPLAAGYPVMAGPRISSKRIAVVATSPGPSDLFGAGSSGSMSAIFANVRTN